ncbi:MAG: capsular polysaccharide biosynthesis protein CapF [Muribaculaceae bacterium]|nr:capsular polysaccharide biosynthesis protein CapF [Muribaculaceae bacterium]
MKVLVTGAKGFAGKNLCARLKNIRDGKCRIYPGLEIEEVMEFDVDTPKELLREYCSRADFVFNLAGVNRPKDPKEFMEGNFGFASELLDTLKECGNTCPVMISSSTQAALDNPYGESKRAGEHLLRNYSRETGAKVLIYRFPNLFGKWCRPNYNSAVATFCNNIANGFPITVNNEATELNLVYIDDMVEEMVQALMGKEHKMTGPEGVNPEEEFCAVPVVHNATLGEIVRLLHLFSVQPETLMLPSIPDGSFAKKLYSTYLSYLPEDKVKFPLKMNVDARGSFTELLKTADCGQFSVNVSLPGITKGEHWHDSKWEFFIVVSGKGLIQMRCEADPQGEIREYHVSGEKIEAVHMLPGYTHNIINLSETEPMVTLMWANENFDSNRPDTYFDPVKR